MEVRVNTSDFPIIGCRRLLIPTNGDFINLLEVHDLYRLWVMHMSYLKG